MKKFLTVEFFVLLFFVTVYASVMIFGIVDERPLVIVVGAASVLAAFVPFVIRELFDVQISWIVQFFTHIFLVLCLVFGELFNFYMEVPWWDAMLHTTSSFGITLVAFCLIRFLFQNTHIKNRSIFCLTFALAISFSVAFLWELYEFAIDTMFKTNMQKWMFSDGGERWALMDTMTDLTCCFLGSIAAILFIIPMRNKKFLYGAFVKRIPVKKVKNHAQIEL
jgi:hypothetical protein